MAHPNNLLEKIQTIKGIDCSKAEKNITKVFHSSINSYQLKHNNLLVFRLNIKTFKYNRRIAQPEAINTYCNFKHFTENFIKM